MPTLLKEPLLHFLLIGALLFAVYSWLNPDATGADDSRIEITPGVTQRPRGCVDPAVASPAG